MVPDLQTEGWFAYVVLEGARKPTPRWNAVVPDCSFLNRILLRNETVWSGGGGRGRPEQICFIS